MPAAGRNICDAGPESGPADMASALGKIGREKIINIFSKST